MHTYVRVVSDISTCLLCLVLKILGMHTGFSVCLCMILFMSYQNFADECHLLSASLWRLQSEAQQFIYLFFPFSFPICSSTAIIEHKYNIKIHKCDKSKKWLIVLAKVQGKKEESRTKNETSAAFRRSTVKCMLRQSHFIMPKNPTGSYVHLYLWWIYSCIFLPLKSGLQRQAVGLNFQLGRSYTSVAIFFCPNATVLYLSRAFDPIDVIFAANYSPGCSKQHQYPKSHSRSQEHQVIHSRRFGFISLHSSLSKKDST